MALHGKNILLRGCQLRNTEWCRGVVVYTGRETKIQMNAADPAAKTSSLKPYVDRETLRVLCVQVGRVPRARQDVRDVSFAFAGTCLRCCAPLRYCSAVSLRDIPWYLPRLPLEVVVPQPSQARVSAHVVTAETLRHVRQNAEKDPE